MWAASAFGQVADGHKTKVKGTIASRNGDVVTMNDKKAGTNVNVVISADTQIEREHGKAELNGSP
jgi:hypothetical protein